MSEVNGFGVDKIERYKWDDISDEPGKLEYIDKHALHVDAGYQRSLSPHTSRNIASSWSWMACGAITVARRSGKYYVIDGQHRVEAARKRSDIRELPCVVFHTKDIREEAIGFVDANVNRKPLSPIDRHNANLVANDDRARQIQQVINDTGLELNPHPTRPEHIQTVTALYQAFDKGGASHLYNVLSLAKAVSTDTFITAYLFKGIDYIASRLDITDPKLRARFVKTGYKKLKEGITKAAIYYDASNPRTWALGMIKAINYGYPANRRYELFTETENSIE